MNYCELFTEDHIALISDWFAVREKVFVHIYAPHSGKDGFNFTVTSLNQLYDLIAKQDSKEIEMFVFRDRIENENELDEKLDSKWAYGHTDDVVYIAVLKNRNWYAQFHDNPESYSEVIKDWNRKCNR